MGYTYYGAATLGFRFKYAKVLTNMQMIQFLLGITLSSLSYWYRFSGGLNGAGQAQCPAFTDGSKQSLVLIQLYALGLLYLFNEMAKKKYSKGKQGSNGKTNGKKDA